MTPAHKRLIGPQPWPTTASWLDDSHTKLEKAIVLRAFRDLGICEIPPGSNRSGRIDTYNERAGVELASYYCASWLTAVWEDAGAATPDVDRASCDMIYAWARRRGLIRRTPRASYAVLYGTHDPFDAVHCGLIVRTDPILRTIEANTTISGFDRNGNGVELKLLDTKRVIAYVAPIAR